jgi:uncharacterized protein DUF1761
MPGINSLAIIAAALATFVASSAWYILFGRQLRELSPAMANMRAAPVWKKIVVVLQGFVLAFVVAMLIERLQITTWSGGALLGSWLWLGLSAVQWVGSIMWENVPLKLAAIHAGDWLVKLILVGAILGAWH